MTDKEKPMKREILNKSLRETVERGNKLKSEYESKVAAVSKKEPRIAEIDRLLNINGIKLINIAMSGDKKAIEKLKESSTALISEKNDILKKNGLDSAPAYKCKKCNDTGYVCGKMCECVYENAKVAALSELFGGFDGEVCTFNNFDLSFYSDDIIQNGHSSLETATNNLETCKKFVQSFPSGKNLLLTGGCGLGKTHLALAIAGEIALKGYDVICGSAQNIITKAVRDSSSWDSTGEYVDRLLECDLLVIDDLGVEFSSPMNSTMVYNIIDTRIKERKSTVFTTNLDFAAAEKRYDPRVVSRLMGDYTTRIFFGNDIRQQKKIRKMK